MGHLRLHLFVRSTFASPVWLRCRSHSPQSKGHRLASLIAGFITPTPSLAQDSTLRYMSTSDQTTSAKLPCSGQLFSMTTLPPFSLRVALMIFRHSGQRLSVVLGRPLGMALSLVSIMHPCGEVYS